MARNIRYSIYGEKIRKLNVTDILGDVLEEAYDIDWEFDLQSDWVEKIKAVFDSLDFADYNYISDYGVYWCGVLTLEPFHTLSEKYGGEEGILNTIKKEHLRFVQNNNGVEIEFYNPTKSPLYRFFNQYKEDGYGENITYSVNVLLKKIEAFLKKEFENNLSKYGQWIPYEEEQLA